MMGSARRCPIIIETNEQGTRFRINTNWGTASNSGCTDTFGKRSRNVLQNGSFPNDELSASGRLSEDDKAEAFKFELPRFEFDNDNDVSGPDFAEGK